MSALRYSGFGRSIEMSRAFVKEDVESPEEILARPISSRPNFVTAEGRKQIDQALARYEAAHTAAVHKENRTAIELTAREVSYWSNRKNTAIVVSEASGRGQVQFGASVTVRRHDGRVQTLRIVGEDEADPSAGTISYVSPFAQAVMGKSVGDCVQIAGSDSEILAIE
jgi:transcription elongation GreA/GreB family factor